MSDETKDVEGLLRILEEPCDHKRLSCEEIGCNGPVDQRAAATIRTLRSEVEAWKTRWASVDDRRVGAEEERDGLAAELERKDAALEAIRDYGDTDHEGLTADKWDKVHGPTWGDVSRAEIARRALAPVAEQEASDE